MDDLQECVELGSVWKEVDPNTCRNMTHEVQNLHLDSGSVGGSVSGRRTLSPEPHKGPKRTSSRTSCRLSLESELKRTPNVFVCEQDFLMYDTRLGSGSGQFMTI